MRLQPPKRLCLYLIGFLLIAITVKSLFVDLFPLTPNQHGNLNNAYSHEHNACTKVIAIETEFVSLLAPQMAG
jgi:hypothetical protein